MSPGKGRYWLSGRTALLAERAQAGSGLGLAVEITSSQALEYLIELL